MGVDADIDITTEDRKKVLALLQRHLPGTTAWVYGSRTKWTSRPQSDLDLVVFATPEQRRQVGDLREAFDESNLPFRVDLFVWDDVPDSFRKQIQAQHVPLVARIAERLSTTSQDRDNWSTVRLGDAVDLLTGFPFRSDHYTTDSTAFRLLRGDNIAQGYLRWNGVKRWPAGAVADLEQFRLREGDVVLAMDRPWIEVGLKSSSVQRSDLPALLVQRVARLRGKRNLDTRFLKYVIACRDFTAYVLSVQTGTAVPHISARQIQEYEFPLPPLAEQRAIAHILGTLDDKIELNRRMNATLVAMARALFRSWFVDFDPVRAKMEGRDTGLPKDIADLFPDRLVESELGEIPLGWPVERLADHFEAVKGVSYKGSGLGGDGVPLHNLNSVYEGGGYKYEGIKFYSGEYAERHHVRPGDVIVANTEQGHERLLIGYAAIVPKLFGGHGIYSHHIYRLRPRNHGRLSTPFLHLLLNSPWMHDLVSGYANGTTVNMLPMDAVEKPMVLVPPKGLLEAFDVLALQLEHRREEAVRDSRTLGVLQDALVPKLVSGKLRVNTLEPAYRCDAPSASVGAHEA